MDPVTAPARRQAPHLLGWLLLFLLLWLPVDMAGQLLGDGRARWLNLLASLSAVVAALGLRRLWPSAACAWMLLCVALVAFLLRATHLGLIHFSGAGFSIEFFIHLEWQSVKLAAQQYPGLLAAALLGLVLLAALLGWLLQPRHVMRRSVVQGLALLLAAGVGAALARAAVPEYQLLRAWQQWSSPLAAALPAETLARWQGLDWLQLRTRPKQVVAAHPGPQARNLVMVYLESIGTPLIEHPRWPGLMPHLARLQREHALLPHLEASAFITIEGLVNSQCGSLLPFQRDSDSYASGEGLFERMTCLGDVLARAGYRQSYLGGAGMGFAGKGAFLSTHGYDRLLGYEHWSLLGMEARPGTWGLSDAELFEQALLELDRLRAEPGLHQLTLLTIGTHLPGFVYEECAAYALPGGHDPFLQSLHCTDQLLGRFVDALQARGVFEDTVLVITADHHVFPNPDMRRLFGDTAVEERRLPLIVLGPDPLPPAAQARAASFDLAPTLLDLLDVRHDARFALGRSLLRPGPERSYLPNRYYGVHDGAVVSPDTGCGPRQAPPRLPLDPCDHRELLQVLAQLSRSLSEHTAGLDCEAEQPLRLALQGQHEFDLWLNGEPQRERFHHNSRPLRSVEPGLYRLAFGPGGEVAARDFLHAELDDESLASRPAPDGPEHAALAVWLPGDPGSGTAGALANLLSSLLAGFDPDVAAAWWIDSSVGSAELLAIASEGAFEAGLDGETCRALMAGR